MSVKKRPQYTLGEYFGIEQIAGIRHEYLDGDIFAMVGGTLNHNQIKDNCSEMLRRQLKGRNCRVLTSDMRVKTGSGLYTYPDLVALCIEPALETGPDGIQTLLNPTLIVEVLSKSTADYDQEGKFEHYKTIPTFQEYLLIDQYQAKAIVYTQQPDKSWPKRECHELNGRLFLASINAELIMSEAYELIEI